MDARESLNSAHVIAEAWVSRDLSICILVKPTMDNKKLFNALN